MFAGASMVGIGAYILIGAVLISVGYLLKIRRAKKAQNEQPAEQLAEETVE